MSIENLPRSNAEAQAKMDHGQNYYLKEGFDACYDVLGGDETKYAKLNVPEFTNASRFVDLFRCLCGSQTDQTNESL